MKKPVMPSVLYSDSARQIADALRRLRQVVQETLDWIGSGTRTEELPTATTKADTDYIEIVQNGVRRKITVADLLDP
jgi:hypothetical protein